jgi:hypothetical protein
MPDLDNKGALKPQVAQEDFVLWAEKYIIAGIGFKCTGLELYVTRCALLNNHGFEAALTVRGFTPFPARCV